MRARRLAVVVGAVVGALLLLCGGFVVSIGSGMPSSQGARVDGGERLIGVETGGSYAWIVRGADGLVLIDGGLDAEAKAVREELDRQGLTATDLRAILVTHGHADHVNGLGAFADVPVYVGPGEAPLVRGEVAPGGLLPRVFGSLMGGAPVPNELRELTDGQVLELAGERITAVHVPGHTGGSTMYVWDGVLFTGDSLAPVGDGVQTLPSAFADDIEQNRASLRKLEPIAFTRIADGHGGITADGRARFERWLRE